MSLNPNHLREHILSINIQEIVPLIRRIYLKENENDIILTVNSLIIDSKTRIIGLELVNVIAVLCSYNSLEENSLIWANYCIVEHTNDKIKEVKLKTIATILKSTTYIDYFNKKFLSDNLSNTLKTCLLSTHTNSENVAALKCLTECIKRYPNWFGNHKSKVEPFLHKFLESSKQNEVTEAAIAYHFFQQTGSAGIDSVNYVNNFANEFKRLCATVHSLYDELFEDLNEIDNTEKLNVQPISLTSYSSNLSSKEVLELMACRLLNALTFVKTMIVKQFPVMKQIVPKHIIEVITRGLSVHVCLFKGELSLQTNVLSLFVNKIQIKLLQLLRIFIRGYLSSILPFSHAINQLLLNNMKRIQSCDCFHSDKFYRESVYNTLDEWICLSKSCNEVHLQESFISLLLKDIVPVKKGVSLNLNLPSKDKGKGKQKKVQIGNLVGINETLHNKRANLIQEVNFVHALKTLKTMTSTLTISINQTMWQELLIQTLRIIFDIQSGVSDPLYDNISCQLHLYDLLLSFYQQETQVLPPIQSVCVLFENGAVSRHPEISKLCTDGLRLLEKICQPVCPSLNICQENIQAVKDKIIKTIDMEEISKEDQLISVKTIYISNSAEDEEENDCLEVIEINDVGKDIEIIEEIVIQPPIVLDDEESEKETNNEVASSDCLEIKEDVTMSVDQVVVSEESLSSASNRVISAVDSKMNGNDDGLEEPPLKKLKDDDEMTVKEMLAAFQAHLNDDER